MAQERAPPGPALEYSMHPTMWVWGTAALDIDQGGAQRLRLHGRAAVADRKLAVLRLDRADRGEDRRRAAREGLRQPAAGGVRPPLLERVGLFPHRDAL